MKLVLTDKNNKQKAEVLVESFKENLVLGTIVSYSFDEDLLQNIADFEDLVNSFTLTLLDEVAEKIDNYQWQVMGKDWQIFDFQIFELKHISFRIKKDI